jgi:leucyl/phenylalanyl-tRNA---protein transferase
MTASPPSRFPDPRTAPRHDALAVGGDLDPLTLLDAYSHGIFPWPNAAAVVSWWSPDPRAVIPIDGLHVSRSLRRVLRSRRFHCTVDTAFADVVHGCADRPAEETWITPPLVDAYLELHRLGHAHSVETWDAAGRLAGGLFGITVGAAFTGESMFHRRTDASKVALAHLVDRLRAGGFILLDVQLPTPHLASLGAVEVPRGEFLDRLAEAVRRPATWDKPLRPDGPGHPPG